MGAFGLEHFRHFGNYSLYVDFFVFEEGKLGVKISSLRFSSYP